MKISKPTELGTVVLEPENGKKITDKKRSFYASRVETRKECVDYYEEVYYNEILKKEVDKKPETKTLTEEQQRQIDEIQSMMIMLQNRLDDILK